MQVVVLHRIPEHRRSCPVHHRELRVDVGEVQPRGRAGEHAVALQQAVGVGGYVAEAPGRMVEVLDEGLDLVVEDC